MGYKLQISEAADSDITHAIAYYEHIRKGLSIDFELCLEEGYADILRTPLGYQYRYEEVRVKFIRRFPFGIHYLVEGTDIYVLSVFHTSQNPKKWTNRLSSE
ncbi:type II toxin-antitoxin system RelE/ParE family toxin [Sediminicola luteus]|uniref:Plasmid stabilization protein n=1 Tax=Sediminicola luteus TaxID=319238 RepID=A0A2A4GDC4_9FLAO|nr:hypothetical protein B7P33_01415 [Sediminicola luteus]